MFTTAAGFVVTSERTRVDDDRGIRTSTLLYEDTIVKQEGDAKPVLSPYHNKYVFETRLRPFKTGLMLVGMGGNNGSTLVATMAAHRHRLTWKTRWGLQRANFIGSLALSGTIRLGRGENGGDCWAPLSSLIPMVDPTTMPIHGWDISGANMAEAMTRAQVLEPDLIAQLEPILGAVVPLPGAFDPSFVAMNQGSRATNIIAGSKKEQLARLRADIRAFRESHSLEQVVVLWTANTERFSSFPGTTGKDLLDAIEAGNDAEISPSTLYATAAILENAAFINGSPQNTLIASIIDLALTHRVPIAGDDFKSGQTKLKSVLVDFLISAGLRPISIASYNHLGNNDGLNLSAPSQFRSKEISKSGVIEDMVASNSILYPDGRGPDHLVVIKYVPAVGDSKRALDEYETEIYCGGRQTMSIHTTCEDSLLAVPLMIDLVLFTELIGRRIRLIEPEDTAMHPILSHLSYCLKAPLFPGTASIVNSLFSQRLALENFLRALIGLPPSTHMDMEARVVSTAANK